MNNGLSNRWVRGNLLLTALFLLGAEALLMLYTVNNSYAAAQQSLQSELTLISSRLEASQNDSVRTRGSVLRTLVQETAENREATYILELRDENGRLYATSEGFYPQDEARQADAPEDFRQAVLAESGTAEAKLHTADGEKVLAMTWLIPVPAGSISAVRLVTSLEGIYQRILQVLVLSVTVVLACFALIVLTGVYFIRSIVRPLAQVEATATKIAQGNFDIRLEKKHNDEIGRLCETINHMAEDLSKTEKLKNEFISSVSHELRTPLTSIKGWTETLQRIDDVKDKNYVHGMRIISGETDRLYDMVEELLDFSRMQNKGLELHCTRLDLAAEVGDAVLMAQQRAQQNGVSLCYEEPEAVLAVQADANRLKQVFINVLDNAVKYSPAGGTITVTVTCDGSLCRVAVADQGPGIAPDELELVKTKFYKGRGAVRGSGIGLAVASEIMQAHGGELRLSSVYGMGTTVTLELPQQVSANELS